MPGADVAERPVALATPTVRVRQRPWPTTRPGTRRGFGFTLGAIGLLLLSFNTIRVAGDYPVSDLFFVGAVVVVFLSLIAGNMSAIAPAEMRRTSPLILVGSLLLLTGGVLSSFWSLDVFGSILRVVRLGWITVAWFWLFRAITPDMAALNRLIRAFKVTMLIASAIALTNYVGVTALGETRLVGRENAYFTHPNMLGSALAVALPFFLMNVATHRHEARSRHFVLAVLQVGVIGAAVSATGSMTAMTGAVVGALSVGILLMVVQHRKTHHKARRFIPLVVLGLVGAGLLLLSSSDLPVVDRFTDLISSDSSSVSRSASSRPQQNQFVIDRLDRYLFVGVGHDTESAELEWNNEIIGEGAHNIFVKVLYEAGLIAVVGFAIILIAVGRQAWILIVRARATDKFPTMVALLASFVAANAVAQLNPVITERWFWLPAAFITVAWAMRYREFSAAAEAEDTPLAATR